MPVRVYLDTSDYSALYQCDSVLTEDKKRIKRYILDKTDQGEIEVFYSFPIVWELLQNFDDHFKDDRHQRAYFIHRICRHNSFRYPLAHNFVSEPISRNGHWFPRPRKPLVRELKEATRAELGKKLSRKQRRSLNRDDIFRQYIYENPHLCDLKQARDHGIPIPDEMKDDDFLYRYIMGQLPEEKAEDHFLTCITDLNNLLDLWYGYLGGDNIFRPIIENTAGQLRKDIQKLVQLMLEAEGLGKNSKALEQELKRTGFFDEAKTIRSYRQEISVYKDVSKLFNFTDGVWAQLPAHMPDLVVGYVRQRAKEGGDIKSSDVGDIFHSVYVPFCDLWRGDKHFCDTIAREIPSLSSKIVHKLGDLPPAIEYVIKR